MTSREAFLDQMRPPPGRDDLPHFDRGWEPGEPYLAYAGQQGVNWSDELEDIHEESSRDHFIDVWTRRAMIEGLGPGVPPEATVVDLGCSTGYLLADLRERLPHAFLVGVDLVAAGLRKAHELVPDAALLQADVCDLPFADASVDAVVSANLLEHVPDDRRALREVARILRPGARAAMWCRRVRGCTTTTTPSSRTSVATGVASWRARRARRRSSSSWTPTSSLLYPPFWLTKKLKRRRGKGLSEVQIRERVTADIDRTQGSTVGAAACALERRLFGAGIRLPFDIRGLTVAWRPLA